LGSSEGCRLVVIGKSLAVRFEAARDSLTAVTLVASYRDTESFQTAVRAVKADVLVIEEPTLQAETVQRLVDWMMRVNATHAIVVYRFAAQATLRSLPSSKCSALRAPVDPQMIQTHCVALMAGAAAAGYGELATSPVATESARPRRYDDETLARLATLSSAVQCECPRHLAELISALCAFENYSAQCESRNPGDAALHAYLHATTSRARHMIETALAQVIEAENISV
jgi:hypothetical protein